MKMKIVLQFFLALLIGQALVAQQIDMSLFHGMQPRNIGPAGMSGRVTSIDVVLNDTDHIYIGTAAGGVWESKNNGHTWTPIFDDQKAASIGAVAIYQKNPSTIYVGTGEGNPRNSQNSGRGMYKSLDGGKTWQFLGLENTRQIHRVIVHPDNSDIVWAGVSGASWGSSTDRGVYKTIDGGKSWKKILYVNEHTGVADMVADPNNPNKIFVAMWEHYRKPWNFKSGGAGSGLYVTHDGGEEWDQITTEHGLPKGELGRIGVAIAPTSSDRVYAYVENESNAIYRSDDGGGSWKQVSKKGDRNIGGRPFYYADIYVDTQNENRLYSIATEVTVSEDGGKTWSVFAAGNKIHTDHHAWWSHPDDNKHIIIGHDGGLNTTYDRGQNWGFADNLPLAQFYHIRVDDEFPYHVMGGLQDNGSWRGPNRTWFKGGIRNMYWQRLSVGDGFDVVPDPMDPTRGYAMGQGGNLVNYHTTSGQLKKIKPVHPTGEHLRFNWNAGIGISPIDQKTIYYGSQYLHKSTDNGQSWTIISPDLTTNDPEKTQFLETGGITYDVTGAENHCTIISIDPSPLDADVIWVGTDDGNIQVTRDGGDSWTNTTANLRGVAEHAWVTQVTASIHDPASAVVVIDDHRRNNWEPYVYITNNYGKSWNRIADSADIDGYVYCFAQDPIQPKLMFIGSEFGLYVSIDAGQNWNKWTEGIPTMPVSDMAIQSTEHDLVIGTFGRAIWILDDIRPLRELASKGISQLSSMDIYAFTPPDEHVMIIGESIGYRDGKVGDALYNGENRPHGALISYWAGQANDGEVKVLISDEEGNPIRHLTHESKPGVNRLVWDMKNDAIRNPRTAKPKKPMKSPRGGLSVSPGDYQIQIIMGADTSQTWIKLSPDPRLAISDQEIANKKVQMKEYSKEANRLTDMADDFRNLMGKIDFNREMLDQISEEDQYVEQSESLSSLKESLKNFEMALFGDSSKQGIYRDPAVLVNELRAVSYLIDHPLSPATQNQATALNNLTEHINEMESDWSELSKTILSQLGPIQQKLIEALD